MDETTFDETDKPVEALDLSQNCYTPGHCNFETDGAGIVSCSVCRIVR